jgi:hypothetical protein
MMISARRVLAVVVMLLASVAQAGADRQVVPRAVLIRMEGHMGAARADDRGLARLTLRRDKATVEFQVNEIWVLSGDLVGLDILHEVEPYEPNMSLAGPPEVVDRLLAASSDELLEITGYYRRGVRILMLSSVERAKKRDASRSD